MTHGLQKEGYQITTMDYSWKYRLSYLDTGLDCNIEHKLWAVAFTLDLLKTRLNFLHSGTEEDGAWETQGAASIST